MLHNANLNKILLEIRLECSARKTSSYSIKHGISTGLRYVSVGAHAELPVDNFSYRAIRTSVDGGLSIAIRVETTPGGVPSEERL